MGKGIGLVLLTAALGASSSSAQHREGEYGGVTPGVVTPYEALPKKRILWKNNRKNAMYWAGYLPSKDRIFLQLSSEVAHETSAQGKKAWVFLPGIRPARGNWWRRMDTSGFKKSLQEIRVKRVGKRSSWGRAGLVIELTFEEGGSPSVTGQTLEDGFHYLMLTL